MSSFFTLPASQRKRKRNDDREGKPSKRRPVERANGVNGNGNGVELTRRRPREREQEQERDDSISGSDSEEGDVEIESGEESEATSEENETAADRRIRLAQRYLDNIKEEVDTVGFDAADIDRDLIAERLKEDVDEAQGRRLRSIAQALDFENATHCNFDANTQSTTAVSTCAPYAYTVSKDTTLIKWQLQTPETIMKRETTTRKSAPPKRKPKQLEYVRGVKIRALAPQQHGHTGPILSVAASPDGRFVATGGADKKMIIWSAENLRPLKTFTVHRDSVTGLAFAPSSSNQPGLGTQLFSASADRSLKSYSLASEESLAYVETLFGHQDHVLAVSAMAVDQCVSVGARDRTARLWKVVDETQLKFLGDSNRNDVYQTGSLDCVAALTPQHFVTGSDSGAISLWSMHKKKALFTIQTAHETDDPPPFEEISSESNPDIIARLKKHDTRRPIPRAITALAALPGTDVIMSGSWDGWIRVWKLSDDKRSLLSVGKLGQPNNAIQPKINGTSTTSPANDPMTIEQPTPNIPIPLNPHAHSKFNQEGPIRGIINSIDMFERRQQLKTSFGAKKEGECLGLCVVAGTGKEGRLGRWIKFPRGKNGAVVFEIPVSKVDN